MTRSRLIVVASAKGSPGATFIALGVAGRMAEAGLSTLLVDADSESGSIAASLDLGPSGPRAPLAGLGPLTAPALAGAAVTAAPGLHCLDLSAESEEVEGRLLAEAARSGYAAIVADLGHRFERFQRELAACADWLVWVVAPDRVGFERADRVLAGDGLPRVSAGIVLNRLGSEKLSDAGVVLAERHHLPLFARLPENAGAARAAARRSGSPHRVRAFRRHFAELARCLHPDVHGGGGDRWP